MPAQDEAPRALLVEPVQLTQAALARETVGQLQRTARGLLELLRQRIRRGVR